MVVSGPISIVNSTVLESAAARSTSGVGTVAGWSWTVGLRTRVRNRRSHLYPFSVPVP